MVEEIETLCLFTPHGCTFTFHKVEVTLNNETMLAFKYTGKSDGRNKVMFVQKANITGYSVALGARK